MECDRSFGLIERNAKKNPQVFIPEHWVALIKNTTENFIVKKMSNSDFRSFKYLHDIFKDSKKDNQGSSLKWREIVWFKYNEENNMSFCFKKTRNIDVPFEFSENLATRKPAYFNTNCLNTDLYQSPKKIPYAKWENLITLLEFIPPVYHSFYNNLVHEKKATKKRKLTRKKLQKYWWKRLWSQMKMKSSTKTILLNLIMKTINILF
nr:unnamed protein product [Callosobruchus chinensis]